MKRIIVVMIFLVSTGLITGCSQTERVTYKANDFINPNRVVVKHDKPHLSVQEVDATYGFGNNVAVERAYKRFLKKGVAQDVSSRGFKTVAYDAYAHPIVECAPLHLCVVQLERGERVNNIDLGDSSHWMVGTSLIGSATNGSYQVVIKPKLYDIATDMVITTNKRTYNVGLVSKRGAYTHVVNFYYPQETLSHTVAHLAEKEHHDFAQQTVSTETGVKISHVNFNYVLSGDYPAWRPIRVFDDGLKTFIQMPLIASRLSLPVLYLAKQGTMALVNYRYKRPYYIIDGLFKTAYLVSGKGSNQIKVIIRNQNFS